MPCFYPVRAYRVANMAAGKPTGGYSISFTEPKGDLVTEIYLPCGSCDGCRIERSRQWAIRCVHESRLHDENCVISLTYNEENIPDGEELQYKDFQLFMKRMRKSLGKKKIKYFVCGEYGEGGRPHFHACIFGHFPNDAKYFKMSKSGTKLYTSKWIEDLWSSKDNGSIGFSLIGHLDYASAAYIARYVVKKANGREYQEKEYLDLETGEVFKKEQEFIRMSLKPAIGRKFYEKYKEEMFPNDYVVINGKKMKPPKYYTKLLAKDDNLIYSMVQDSRIDGQVKNRSDNTQARLEVKEKVLKARLAFLKRNNI